jgi:hypothetical protein
MADLKPHKLDLAACRKEVLELKQLLDNSADLSERKDIAPFFKARPQLSALTGIYNPDIARFDLLAWEYVLFGDFQCDIVVGDSVRKAYTFLEFEDARPNSVFVKQGAKATREWSSRFEHGYSQLIDWFYKLTVMTDTPDMEARLGKRSIDYTGVLVVGRDQYIDHGERMRLDWRRQHVVVHSKKIHCITFDQLVEDLLFRLDSYALAAKAGG